MNSTQDNSGKDPVRVFLLPAMRAARFHVMGKDPELDAFAKLCAWAELRRLEIGGSTHPVFGFNNPNPLGPCDEYGYEFWLRIEPDMAVEAGMATIDFPGGWYAMMTHHGPPTPDVWQTFAHSVRHTFSFRHTHELERPVNPLASELEMIFELYLPIEGPSENASAKQFQ